MSELIYDVIIVGAGPAGLTAALYSARRNLKTLVLTKDLGGQSAIIYEIENYPGVEIANGLDLMNKFAVQAKKFGAEIKLSPVLDINKEKKYFAVTTAKEKYLTRAIILSFGLVHKDLAIPGEKEFLGRGVSYCATCDGPLYKNKTVAVIGGGNSALEAAEFLAQIAKQVYLIHRRDQFRGEEFLVDKIKGDLKVKMVLSSQIMEIKGNGTVKSVVIKKNGGDQTQEIDVDGVFVEIGYSAKTDFIKNLVDVNEKGEIITDKNTSTSQPGVFAGGDVTDGAYKQVVISAGEGAKAALQAYKYLRLGTGEKILPDWKTKK